MNTLAHNLLATTAQLAFLAIFTTTAAAQPSNSAAAQNKETTGSAQGASWTKDAEVQVVPVNLHQWTLGFETVTITKPKARFEIENTCSMPHAFEIEGKVGGQEVEFATGVLQPNEKSTMIVHLPPGEYEAYCPVGQHEAKGMKGKVIFRSGGSQ